MESEPDRMDNRSWPEFNAFFLLLSSRGALTDDDHGLGGLGAALGGHVGDGFSDGDGFFGHSGGEKCSRGGGRTKRRMKKKRLFNGPRFNTTDVIQM